MKRVISILILVVLVVSAIFESCEPAATFDTPQPENVKSIANFPKHLLGNYSDSNHASILTISENLIIRHFDFDYKEHKDSIGYSYKIIGDTLIDTIEGRKEKISIKGDSIIRHENWIDTIFNLSGDNMLRKYKGF